MKKITLCLAFFICGISFSQTVLLDGGTSGTALWDEAFGQGSIFLNPLPVVEHVSVVDSKEVLLIEKNITGSQLWHLVGCRKNGDGTKGVAIDATNYIIQLKFRTNKDTNKSISV